MIRVAAFLLLKWGPFAHHSAVRECPVRRRPVEKPPPSSGAGASPSQRGGPLARVGQGKVPRGPGAGPAWVRGGLRDCPTPPDPAPRRLSEHGGAAVPRGLSLLPEPARAPRHRTACPGTGIWPSPATTANTAFVPETSKCSLIIHICHLLRNR